MYLKPHKRYGKACAIANVKRMYTKIVMACPTEQVSSGKISLGINHLRGPHDHPNATINKQMATMNNVEGPLDIFLSPPNFRPEIICQQQSMKNIIQYNYR